MAGDGKNPNIKVEQQGNTVDKGDIVGIKYDHSQTNIIISLAGYRDLMLIVQSENLGRSGQLSNAYIQEALNRIIQAQKSSIASISTSMSKKDFPQNISDAAALTMEKGHFGKAFKIFAVALEDAPDEHFNLLFKDYLITGFIHFCQENNMQGLRGLLSKQGNSLTLNDSEIALITANIMQEICSRETNLTELNGYMPELEDLYEGASDIAKSPMANSLGLAYRRLGERGDMKMLQKAIDVFDAGLSFKRKDVVMEVDLKDQKAITHVRIFEYGKEVDDLIKAENLLKECVGMFDLMTDYRGIRLKPRVLNNLGNVYKQKALELETGKVKNAKLAISTYEEAEQFWPEKTAGYEWALLQKNKAEAKYALAKSNPDSALLIDALRDCSKSVVYRNFENSPYQWGKTVEISFQIVLLLDELKCLQLIPKELREGIISYTERVADNNSIWTAKNFNNILPKAKRAQALLNN